MKNLGPKGDEIADIISPPDNGQGAQQAQQMQQQMALQGQALQAMQAELQKLQLERAGKVIDNQAKAQIEQMKIEAQVTAAEINTKAQSMSERVAFVEDLMHKLLDQAHDVGTQAQDHANATAQAQAAAEQQRQAATQDQAHQQGMAAQSQGAAAQQAELARQAQPAEPAD
jgi:myosin heavy subunit